MQFFSLVLADSPVNEFWAAVIPVARIVIVVLMALFAIATIVFVFMQLESGGRSTNVITGNKDSFYSKNKGGNKEGRVTRIVILSVSCIAGLSLLYFLSFLFKV